MDLSAVEAAGALLGTATASFIASWFSIGRPLKKQLEDAEPTAKLDLFGHRIKELEHQLDKVASRVEHNENRTSRMVTDDEFATYTSHTTKAVQNLTEKVGHVTGALEAWYRQPSK